MLLPQVKINLFVSSLLQSNFLFLNLTAYYEYHLMVLVQNMPHSQYDAPIIMTRTLYELTNKLNLIMNKLNNIILILIIAFAWTLTGCGGDGNSTSKSNNKNIKYENKVVMHALSDPEELTPLNSNDNSATMIFYNTFQTLLHIDYKTYEIIPILAKARPVFTDLPGGKVQADLEIRPEAKWDNGDPITGEDVDFSLRVLKNPQTNSKPRKPYFEDIEEVIIDKNNPKKFSLIYAQPYMIIESALPELYIIPAHIYDPEGIMKKFTVKQLYTQGEKLRNNADIKKFAEQYNSSKFQREVVEGSGPYAFHDWQPNQRVILKRKPDWWGYQAKDVNHWFEAYPDELVFESVNDLTTAVVALRGEKIDVMHGIEPKAFVTDLQKSESFTDKFSTHSPPLFSYDYMAINQRLDKFSDVRTRKALAHIMNVDQLIKSFTHGLGERVATFTHPSLKERISPKVKPYAYDIDKARKLLAEAGWKDTDGNGVLDKEIDGEKVDFEINLNFNTGNSRRERACLIFQEEARKAGVKVNILPLEWSVMLERNKSHNFEMFVAGWISSPLESDPKQIWHTDSYADRGSNYTGFGNDKTDKIIENMRAEMDADKRYKYYHQLQEAIHEDVPYIFLLAQKERIAIHKKYNNAYASGIKPGYRASGFQVSKPIAN